MAAKEQDGVLHRFSRAGVAGKWNDMYSSETQKLEEHNFRLRRNSTVAHVLGAIGPGAKVLDLGCGTGPVLTKLREKGVSCVGMDYSQDMLDFAKERLQSLSLDSSDLFQGDCRATPFGDASFDAIVCLGVISYIEDYSQVLRELYRLAKPGALVVISTRSSSNPVLSDPVSSAKEALKFLIGRREAEPYKIGRFMSQPEVTQKIREAGFRIEGYEGIGFGPFKVAGRQLFGEKTGIRLSNSLHSFFNTIHLRWAFRRMADVNLWVCRKPAAGR
jgi:ubiquinone/menaquinone biosynthesis C-methylase UbiE